MEVSTSTLTTTHSYRSRTASTDCGDGSATPDAQSQIALTTELDLPVMGPVDLIIAVKDAQGQPLDETSVLVLVSHTGMSGMDQRGQATAQGNGRYTITACGHCRFRAISG